MQDIIDNIDGLIDVYQQKINEQDILEEHIKTIIAEKRANNKDYADENNQLYVIWAKKQAYVQAKVDIDSIIL